VKSGAGSRARQLVMSHPDPLSSAHCDAARARISQDDDVFPAPIDLLQRVPRQEVASGMSWPEQRCGIRSGR